MLLSTLAPLISQVDAGAKSPVGLDASLLVAAAVGLLAGLALGFVFSRSSERARAAAMRERLRFADAERGRAESLRQENDRLRQALAEAQARHQLDAERLAWLQQAEEQLRASFERLAREVFSGALQEGDGELTARSRETLERVVEPLRLTLAHLDTQVRELERERQGAYQGLRRELQILRDAQRQLHGTTRDLRQALKSSPGSRGRWGEVQLRRLVEMAGLSRHVDYLEQPTVEGGQRPDLVVTLPGGGNLPIDAKTPLRAYLQAAEADEPSERERLLAEHLRAFKARASELGSKAYWRSVPGSPDFVVMFLPHDGVLAAAFERESDLLDYCFERRVLPATPVTLLALLRAVAWGWQRQQVAAGAEKIAGAGRELHARLGRVLGHLARTGRGLDAAVQSYNETIGSLERRLMPAVRRLEEAGAIDQSLETPGPVDQAVRRPG